MKKINVTKTYLPPINEYNRYIKKIWQAGWITNHGPLVTELEKKLKDYLGVKHLFLVTNGTIALQIAIKALELKDEVITTPFSYVATTSSLVWENCQPIFADIDPIKLTIDPEKIEEKITKKTTGIMGVHVYGHPCDVEKIQKIAKKNNLKVIYDAAHAFGVKYQGQSLLNYGDISTLSFHATKIFHTIEGGAIITNNQNLAERIRLQRNFGHVSKDFPEKIALAGINGKASEFQAAMGLCLLPKISSIITARKKVSTAYDKSLDFRILKKPAKQSTAKYNYAYYSVIFPSEKILLKTIGELNKKNIYPRRYFYPSLNTLSFTRYQSQPISEDIAKRIICLPLFPDLSLKNVKTISKIINDNIKL